MLLHVICFSFPVSQNATDLEMRDWMEFTDALDGSYISLLSRDIPQCALPWNTPCRNCLDTSRVKITPVATSFLCGRTIHF